VCDLETSTVRRLKLVKGSKCRTEEEEEEEDMPPIMLRRNHKYRKK
jgi:hypothetical protein